MKKKTYWQRRSEDRLLDLLGQADSVVLKLGRYYDKASKDIDKSIKSLYGQFMVENELNPKKALELIKGKEFREWRMTMEEYLSQIKATNDKALLLELNTLTMRSRINRLEALQAEILAQSAIIASKEEEVIGSFLSDSIEDTYYKNVYDEYKDKNPEALDLMDKHKVAISRNQVKKVLELPWSGANYSENIWNNSYFIAKRAQAMVAKNIIAGRSIENLSRDFAKVYGKQYYSNAKRLIRTETAYVKGQADVLTYEKLGVEEYELLATLDNRTSSICQEKDGKHYPVDDIQVGINYPPFHPNCRTTTIKYREERGDRRRIAKDKDGNKVKVPLGMRYEEWRRWIDGKGFVVVNELSTWVHDDKEYKVDGHHVIMDYSKHEKDIAEILSNYLKKEVRLVPRILYPQEINTPDYLIEGERWDLKDIYGSGKRTLYNALKNTRKQAENFVFDVSNTKLSTENIEKQIDYIFESKHKEYVNRIITIKNNKVLKKYEK